MGWLRGVTGRAILAACVASAIACGDDDRKDVAHSGDGGAVAGDGGAVAPGSGGNPGANQKTDASGPSSPGIDGGGGSGTGTGADGSTSPPANTNDASVVVAPGDGSVVGSPDGGAVGPDGAVLPCGGSCDDRVDCTIDSCVENRCVHRVDDSVCTVGSSCDYKKGCQQGKACATSADCVDSDGCTANERCDPMLARCVWDVLDRDGDGDAPTSCGGTDCNDANGLVGPSAVDGCDGVDNDCDGTVDEAARCGTGQTCTAGACACSAGFTGCGFECVDTKTDADHCGACGQDCGSGGACTNGACSCPAPSVVCGQTCTDTQASLNNCGACGATCQGIAQGGQFQSCLAGACKACGRLDQPCCRAGVGCTGALTCQGTQGAADSKCVCAAGSIMCGMTCVDPSSDEDNCGGCGSACTANEVCLTKGEQTSCVACGGVGEACCDRGFGAGLCRGGAACGPNDTCVRTNVTAQGPGLPPTFPLVDGGGFPVVLPPRPVFDAGVRLPVAPVQ
jgi:hypothetical protein